MGEYVRTYVRNRAIKTILGKNLRKLFECIKDYLDGDRVFGAVAWSYPHTYRDFGRYRESPLNDLRTLELQPLHWDHTFLLRV